MHTHLAGPGFGRRLLANLQHLARRSLLHIKCSLHSILQSVIPPKISKNKNAKQAVENLPHLFVTRSPTSTTGSANQLAATICRQSISDSWLGNLRECLA